jgi:hypothetical protein
MSSLKADEAKKKAEYDAQKAERGLKAALAGLLIDAPAAPIAAPKVEETHKGPPNIGEAIAVIRVGTTLQVVALPFSADSEFKVLHETNSGPLAAKYFHAEILRRTRELGLTRSLTVEQMSVPDV